MDIIWLLSKTGFIYAVKDIRLQEFSVILCATDHIIWIWGKSRIGINSREREDRSRRDAKICCIIIIIIIDLMGMQRTDYFLSIISALLLFVAVSLCVRRPELWIEERVKCCPTNEEVLPSDYLWAAALWAYYLYRNLR